MYQIAKPLFLICETPLHAGSGSDLGIVDLPIQRERHTSFPKIEGSSLKGALREAVEHNVNSKKFANFNDADVTIHRVFGYDDGSLSKAQIEDLKSALKDKDGKEQKDFAGAIGFTDARLLLFPVKSMKGVFAWTTCKKVLSQFLNDMKQCQEEFGIEGMELIDNTKTYVFNPQTSVKLKTDKAVLEEYTFTIANELNEAVQIVEGADKTNIPDWLSKHLFDDDGSYWSEKIKKDIIILPDDDFRDFVNLSTEVITRTKISNETGTVESGALFTEEYLPAESVMYSLVLAHREFRKDNPLTDKEVLNFFKNNLNDVIQIGGSATIGKGLVRTGKSLLKTQND